MLILKFEIPVFVLHNYESEEYNDCFGDFDIIEHSDYVSLNDKMLEFVANDFNESELEQYIWDKEPIIAYVKTIRAKAEKSDFRDSKLYCVVELVDDFPNEQELCREIVDYVAGQCSDGWGEGFEQQDFPANDFNLRDGKLNFYTHKNGDSCLSIWDDKLKQLNNLAKELFPQEL